MPDQVLDWIFSKGDVRCVLANVLKDFVRPRGSEVWASDHMPVAAVFQLL